MQLLEIGGLTEKLDIFLVSSSHHETSKKFFKKLKSFSLVQSWQSDHIQGNTV